MMKQWMNKLKALKKDQILILLLAGVLLLVISIPVDEDASGAPETENTPQSETVPAASKTSELEQRLEAILSNVEGIGRTRVMLTLKSDGRKIVEKDVEQSDRTEENSEENQNSQTNEHSSNENTVLQRDAVGNETPYITEELEPEIEGVLVVAQGADNAQTVSEITDAVMALFGVEAHKIKVMKME